MRLWNKKTNSAGFTLVELLVVISVIGLLASVVLVNMGGAKQQAIVAQSKTFSASIQQKIGIDLVGAWNFDDGSGTVAVDSSGYGSNGDFAGHAPAWIVGSECVEGSCLLFNGSVYVDCGTNVVLTPENITLEAWAKPSAMPTWMGIISNMTSWGTGFSLQMGTAQNIAAMVSGSYLQTSWRPETGKWYHVVATHDNVTNLNILYVNGKKENQSTRAVSYEAGAKTYIGVFYTTPGLLFSGSLDNVRVYGQALSFAKVRENYLAGLEKLLAGGQMDRFEYDQAIRQLNDDYAVAEY